MLSKPPPPSYFSISRQKYDVFLSFRGEDTRLNFTDHLYAALKRNGIVTFKDDPKLEAGEEIEPELIKAIQQSWCSVIIFSETYAFSSWCLEELAEIVEQKKKRGHKIFPIFYGVDSSDLRKQKERVKEAFNKHEERYKEEKDKIQRWRDALTEVANISGWHSNNKPESEFIADIIKKISAKLCQTYPIVSDELIGIDSRLEELHSKINIGEDDVRIIGICGMGGIGKTTLTRVVYAQMSSHFEGKSFLANVREVSEKCGLVSLQKQLLTQILFEGGINIFDVFEGNAMISHRLSCKKVLVVVDDVDNLQQLKFLVGKRDWFGPGSRIIVTTRDEHLLRSYRVDDMYKPTTLNANDSFQLFNLKAFDSYTVPEKDFMELSKQVVKYAGGLPLALEVLGSFLCGRDAAQWKSAIERLKRDSNEEILDVLQISFDGLQEREKDIFLDIACFFNGEKKDLVMKILDGCEFFPDIGLDVLIKKSLVTIDENNRLRMHDLLQEMGRKIVKEKSNYELGKQCRLWEERDVYHVLTKNTATELIEGMIIDIKSKQNKMFTLSADAFSKMKKLRLLKVLCPTNCPDLKYLSNELRLLDWRECPLRSLPSGFQPDNLVALLLSCSHIEQLWEGNRPLYNLKEINLKFCENLIKTPEFRTAPNLQILDFSFCTKLVDVHPSIGVLKRLKVLDLSYCKSLRSLPTKIGMESLEVLDLCSCSNIQRFPEIDGKMECLLELRLDWTSIEELPSSIGHLSRLKILSLRGCKSLMNLPTEIGMECLLKLYLDWTGIVELPSSIGNLSRLKHLSLMNCKNLRSLPTKIGMKSLEEFYLSGCSNLKNFPEIDGKMECLLQLYLWETGIEELPSSFGNLSSLVFLNLGGCSNLASLPSSIDRCKSLKTLILFDCYKVENLPENLQQAELLEVLYMSGTAITKSPSFIFQFKNLKDLSLVGCKGLPSLFREIQRGRPDSVASMLPLLSGLSSLSRLKLRDCNLCEGDIPSDLCCLPVLISLDLSANNFINAPATLARFSKLQYLSLSDCKKLKSLPELTTNIDTLEIGGCSSLEVVANPSKVCNSRRSTYIEAIHCYRLAENINVLTWLKKHLKVFDHSRKTFDIVIPGSEVPEWFNHQRCASSIKIPLPPNIWNDSQLMGVAICCVFVNDDTSMDRFFWYEAFFQGRKHLEFERDELCPCYKFDQPIVKDHLFLHYLSFDNFAPFLVEVFGTNCSDEENDESELSFTFNCYGLADKVKVKKCGARIVFKKDLEEMEQIKEQQSSQSSENFREILEQSVDDGSIGNCSPVKRKRNNLDFEEVEAGPQPKRMQNFSTS